MALAEWRGRLIADLGSEDAITTSQRVLVELASRTWLLVGVVDDFILQMPSVPSRQKSRLRPVVVQRQSLVNQLQSLLRDLGLERWARNVADIRERAGLGE